MCVNLSLHWLDTATMVIAMSSFIFLLHSSISVLSFSHYQLQSYNTNSLWYYIIFAIVIYIRMSVNIKIGTKDIARLCLLHSHTTHIYAYIRRTKISFTQNFGKMKTARDEKKKDEIKL